MQGHVRRRCWAILYRNQPNFCPVRQGIAGLLRDKTRRPNLLPLPVALVDRVVALTLTEPSGEATALDRPGDSRSYRCVAALGAVDLEGAPAAASVRLFKLSQDPAFPAKVR